MQVHNLKLLIESYANTVVNECKAEFKNIKPCIKM